MILWWIDNDKVGSTDGGWMKERMMMRLGRKGVRLRESERWIDEGVYDDDVIL